MIISMIAMIGPREFALLSGLIGALISVLFIFWTILDLRKGNDNNER